MFRIISPRTVALLVTLFAVAVGSGALSLRASYHAGFEQQGRLLQSFVRSQALIIETMADFNPPIRGIQAADLEDILPVLETHVQRFEGFGETGELRLARLVDGEIEFLLPERFPSHATPTPIRLPSERAEAIQRALAGESGIQVGIDHDGVQVLAAFEPLPDLGLGLVAHVDMAEVRAPYVRAAALSGAGGLLLIALGTLITTAVSSSSERERREATRSLAERNELFDAILEQSPVMYVTFGSGRNLTYMNRTFRETFGWTEQDWRERDVIAQLFPDPDHRDEVVHFITEATGEWVDATGVARDGRTVNTRFANYRLPDGTRVAIGLDTTEQRRAETQANETLVALERAEEIAKLGSFSLSMPDRKRTWSKNMRSVLGLAEDTPLPDLDKLEHIHPEDRERIQGLMASPPGPGQIVRTTFRTGSDGEPVRHLEVTGSAVWEDGRVARLEGTLQDVTDRVEAAEKIRRQQEALLAEEQRFRRALQHIPDLIVICDADRRIRFANDAAIRFAGLDRETVLGKREYELLSPDVFERYLPTLEEAMRTRQVQQVRTTVVIGSDERHLHVVCVPLLDVDGSLREVVGIAHDLTEREKAATEIRQLANSLEDTVQRRTVELVGANAELEAFSYTVSHDLKAPLRAIDGFSALLVEGHDHELSDEARRLVAVIRESVQHMGNLVDGLLDFSRLGRRSLDVEPIDMTSLVNELVDNAARAAGERSIQFHVGTLPTIHGDATMIRQVFENLISNAVKFTRDRTDAKIEIGCEGEGDRLRFYVTDNGAGFDASYKDKLFRVFERLHYADEFPGTGVGLAIVKRVVEKHGGSVSATGAVDQGATISVALPS